MSGKLDHGRVDDTPNPTTQLHDGFLLDEVLCVDGGVDDECVGGMDGVVGGWMVWMGRW